MRVFARSLLVLLIVASAPEKLWSQSLPARVVTSAEYESWKKDLSNWGRWGKDDQIGALNLISPAKRKDAAALVKEGYSVSLAGDADTVQAVDNPNPYNVRMLAIGNDRIEVTYHGIAHTHLDSLAHINDNGVLYNGYTPDRDTVEGRPLEEFHPQREERDFYPRHTDRHSAAQRRCVSGAGHADLCGGPRGVGKEGGNQDISRRRFVRAHGRVGTPQGGWAMASRPSRRRQVSRTRSFGHSLAQAARHRNPRQRSSAICLAREPDGSRA